MNELPTLLDDLFRSVDKITAILETVSPIIESTFGKPVASMGIADKVKVARFIVNVRGNGNQQGEETP